jgi:hypothetical protein
MLANASSGAIVLKVTYGGNEKICLFAAIRRRMPFDMRLWFIYTAALYERKIS